MPTFTANQLHVLTERIFIAAGATAENATTVARHLVKSNLAGHDSHGVIIIPYLIGTIDNEGVDPKVKGYLKEDRKAAGVYDGKWGLGQVVATAAMEIAIAKARDYGLAGITIENCGNLGRMADYCLIAAENDMIGAVTVNSTPLMSPFGGLERIFNPSPLGVAVPAGEEKPFVLDISMSVAAAGKIGVKRARGERLPPDWVIDKEGRPTTDPEDFYAGGSLLPIGGPVGYKGYGLAFLIDILSGVLTGNGYAMSPSRKGGNGVFMMAINVDHFTPLDAFKKEMDALIRKVRSSRAAPGVKSVQIPGEPEALEEAHRMRVGIPVEDSTWRKISEIAGRFKVELPEAKTGT